MKVLVADDEGATRLMLETLVKRLGYEPVLASDGIEALEILEREDSPTLAIIDWIMPGLDGVEVCRQVRKLGNRPYVYLIMLTIKGGTDDLVVGMEAGADDYLSKPFEIEELRVRLRAGERILALQDELRVRSSHGLPVTLRGTFFEAPGGAAGFARGEIRERPSQRVGRAPEGGRVAGSDGLPRPLEQRGIFSEENLNHSQ